MTITSTRHTQRTPHNTTNYGPRKEKTTTTTTAYTYVRITATVSMMTFTMSQTMP